MTTPNRKHRHPSLSWLVSLTARRTVSVILTLLLGYYGSFASAAAEPEPNKVSEFMRAKLLHSQRLLEGLTTENFDVIAKQSQELSLLSQAATWQVLQTQEYRDRSTEFRRAAEAVTEAARKKNLDAAALAYVDVTMKCVSCHKYVRHVRMARGLRPHETRVVRLDD
ncbi:MAG: hypothetical protein ACKOUR_09095 [Planctomycetota bacterium]